MFLETKRHNPDFHHASTSAGLEVGVFMILSRQNKYGGVRLQKCPLEEENGILAYKLGYCGHCNEPIRVRTIDAREFMCLIKIGEEDVKKVLKKLKPKLSWREKLVYKLGGQISNQTVDNF